MQGESFKGVSFKCFEENLGNEPEAKGSKAGALFP
jgi:hypothetical protein